MDIFDMSACEELIGYTFKDKMLLRKCFTHASYAHEHGEEDNELLEFFGDAIIEFVVTEYLYKNSFGDEGRLTVKRAEIVSKNPLLAYVVNNGLSEHMLLGEGQKKTSSLDEKLYSSLYEAIVAGIYLDGGIASAKKFILGSIIKDFENKLKAEKKSSTKKQDEKGLFQEYVQKNKLGTVAYKPLSKKGPDHLPEFRAAATLNGKVLAEGTGSSKKAAEMQAASLALIKLKKERRDN